MRVHGVRQHGAARGRPLLRPRHAGPAAASAVAVATTRRLGPCRAGKIVGDTQKHSTPQVRTGRAGWGRRRLGSGRLGAEAGAGHNHEVRVGSGRLGAEAGGTGQWRWAEFCLAVCVCVCVCVCVACMGVGGKGARRLSSDFFSSPGRFSWGVSPHGPEARFWCEPSAHHSRRHAQVEVPVQKLFPWGRVSEAGQLSYKICVFQAPLRGPGASWTTDTRSWCEPSAHPRPRHAQIRR